VSTIPEIEASRSSAATPNNRELWSKSKRRVWLIALLVYIRLQLCYFFSFFSCLFFSGFFSVFWLLLFDPQPVSIEVGFRAFTRPSLAFSLSRSFSMTSADSTSSLTHPDSSTRL